MEVATLSAALGEPHELDLPGVSTDVVALVKKIQPGRSL